jgi:hypothetical protein
LPVLLTAIQIELMDTYTASPVPNALFSDQHTLSSNAELPQFYNAMTLSDPFHVTAELPLSLITPHL